MNGLSRRLRCRRSRSLSSPPPPPGPRGPTTPRQTSRSTRPRFSAMDRRTATPAPAGSSSTSRATPYDRGYQHGRLLAHEIADYVETLATKRSTKAPADAWHAVRTTVERPVPPQVREGVSRGDEGNRRRRGRRRGEVQRAGRSTSSTSSPSTPRSSSTFSTPPSRPPRTGWKVETLPRAPGPRPSGRRPRITAPPSPRRVRPPPMARSSSATSRCSACTSSGTSTSGSTSSRRRAIASSCRPTPAASSRAWTTT